MHVFVKNIFYPLILAFSRREKESVGSLILGGMIGRKQIT